MRYLKFKSFLLAFLISTPFTAQATPVCYPQDQKLYDLYPWSVMYYYGQTVSTPLVRIFEGQFDRWPEHIQSIELAHTLSEENLLRRLVHPIVGIVQVAGNVTVRNGAGEHTIYEIDPYIIFRWANLPWNHYVNTSFAFAEGVSYDTGVPYVERRYSDNTKRLLNYLMFEATFALPSDPQFQVALRIHHRSGCYGLYHAGNTGSNDIGLGISYLFN